MFCHVLIGVLFYVVLIFKGSFGTDETKLIDRLNATLSFPGWPRIANVAAKYRFPVNGNESFTGKDVFVSKNGFVDNENSVINTLVVEDNESVKHYMATHLLGCVYANAMLKFINLLKSILEEINRARKNHAKMQLYHRKKKKFKDADEKNPVDEPLEGNKGQSSEDRPTKETKEDIFLYKTSWTIFNYAVLQLVNSSAMFDRMFSTIKCLIDTTPLGKSFEKFTREMLVILVLPALKLFKNVSKNISLVLPKNYGETEPKFNIDNVCSLAHTLTCFLNNQANSGWRPSLNNYCTVSKEASLTAKTLISLFKGEKKIKPTYTDIALQFGVRIEQLVLEVCNNYHSELGFEYNDSDGTTSFPRTLPQITDSIDEIEVSQNIDN